MSRDRLNVLIVSAQCPFPPRSGFAMRVYQLARQLASEHDVTLLTYATRDQREGLGELRGQMRVEVVERTPPSQLAKRGAQLASLASRQPFSCRAVRSPEMQRAIDRLCAQRPFDVVQLESSLLCTFAFPPEAALVIDEHNVEYELLERMQKGERSLVRRGFNRLEFRRFRRFEQAWWSRADACAVTSDREAEIVAAHAPATPTAVVPNGVDLEVFAPAPVDPEPRTMLFNGILDYRPNLDAAYFVVDEVWPRVRERCADARLLIVGRGLPADLERLRRPGVEVTGEVPDVRPYIARAAVVGVPIRMGGGTRLKVVEGLAMGKAMVTTTLGCEGIAVRDGEHLLVADGAEAFAHAVIGLFDDPGKGAALGAAGRRLMERQYGWDLPGGRLKGLYSQAARERRSVAGRSVPVTAAAP